MKIGHYSTNLWSPGGISAYIQRISKAQKQAGHEVCYLDSVLSGASKEFEKEATDYVADDAALFLRAKHLGLDILHTHTTLTCLPPPTLATVRTVHTHQPYCPSGGRFFHRQEKPCDRRLSLAGCLWGHCIDRCGSLRPQNLIRGFQLTLHEQQVLRFLPTVTVSAFLRTQMLRSGYPQTHVHVLHLPAAPSEEVKSPPVSGVPRFVFWGRLAPQKGAAWLLHALAQVRTQVHLDIAGDGELRAELQHLAAQLGVQDQVTFHGWVPPTEIARLLKNARAAVFPSLWHEPAGLVSLEAFSHARALIGSRVGGIPEYVRDATDGILVAPGNRLELAEAIKKLALDWEQATTMGKMGYAVAREKFSMEKHLAALTHIYRCYGEANDGQQSGQLPEYA